MQLDWHDLKANGCPALLRALKQIETALTERDQAISELQYLLSEEIMVGLVSDDGATIGKFGVSYETEI